MKVTIISGGSGNDALMSGLLKLYPIIDISVITNAYDDGKSTGVCRNITNTLGVSDIRKNHFRMYWLKSKNKDNRLKEFYTSRYDLPKGDERQFVAKKLIDLGLNHLVQWSNRFFDLCDKDSKYDFSDFNIANIVYSAMYSSMGYENTNAFFCKMLNIDDFVILNSYDNMRLWALTANNLPLCSEGEIVDYKNTDPIKAVYYNGDDNYTLNQKAIDAVNDADMIIISAGTFWSSIFPTLQYHDFYKIINDSKARKIWVINNEYDKDAVGVTSNDFIDSMSELGLKLNDWTIITNNDAHENLRLTHSVYKTVSGNLGNINGKHSPELLAQFVLRQYYNLDDNYDSILVDFDDTIWSRLALSNEQHLAVSLANIVSINRPKFVIVSGNNYPCIYDKIRRAIGDTTRFHARIWCDASTNEYKNDVVIDSIESSLIDEDRAHNICSYIKSTFGINCTLNHEEKISCIKIKPLGSLERDILVVVINKYVLPALGEKKLIAIKTGKTTIDIIAKDNDKARILTKLGLDEKKTLFIGDECVLGNDKAISSRTTHFINVENIFETNLILKLL